MRPAALWRRWGADVYCTADGLRLYGWFVPAERPRGTIIFCHGHGGTPAPDLV